MHNPIQAYYKISVRMANVEGSIVRLVGLIERRGFFIHGMRMGMRSGAEKDIMLGIQPVGSLRSADGICKHIDKLHDVKNVHAVVFNTLDDMINAFNETNIMPLIKERA